MVVRNKVGRTSFVAQAISGHTSTVTSVEIKEQIDKCIRDNRRITFDEKSASETKISRGKKKL